MVFVVLIVHTQFSHTTLPFLIYISTGLQTMFIGEYPKLIIYDPSGLVTQEYDMRELSVEQIEETMQKHGLSKMKQ